MHHLKVQMVAGAVARAAYITDHLTSRHGFARRDGCCCHVGIARGQACTVIQQYLIAVAVVPAADQHRAAVGSQDGCAFRRRNVCAAMPGVAEGIHFPEAAGYISVPRKRPLQGAAADHTADTAAQCQQITRKAEETP